MTLLLSQFLNGGVDLAAAFLLLYGLHRMSSPATAPSGILLAGIGMAAAVLCSFLGGDGVGAAARPFLLVNIGLAVIALIIGGISVLLNAATGTERIFGFAAVLLGAGNAAGGFAVTDRMLAMFQRSGKKPPRHHRRHVKKG